MRRRSNAAGSSEEGLDGSQLSGWRNVDDDRLVRLQFTNPPRDAGTIGHPPDAPAE